MKHSSNLKTKAACNCGRKQAERDDPFTRKEANYDFYKKLCDICCDSLDCYEFPVFKGSIPDAKAAEVKTTSKATSDAAAAAAAAAAAEEEEEEEEEEEKAAISWKQ